MVPQPVNAPSGVRPATGADRPAAGPAGLRAAVKVSVGTFDLDVVIEVGQGEIVAIVGPNGAGKSTLLRALAGLIRLREGGVVLNGVVFDDPAARIHLPPEHRPVGIVFQDLLLLPHLSAVENVAFGLRCRGVPRRFAREQALRWLDRFGLAARATARPRELSGGQAQRVALARALAVTPELLLLDEPLSALDVGTRADVRRDLKRALAGFDGVRLIVTHDPTEALTLADRLIIVEGGRVVQAGTPAEITRHPRSRYVAQFVGTNLLRGYARDGQLTLPGGTTLTLPEPTTGEVFTLIHPHTVSLHRRAPHGSPRNVWRGRVDTLDLGADTVRVGVAGNPSITAEITRAAATELALTADDEVWVSVKATEITAYPV
jgi:molybdate transport system ATP-binding protein